MVDEIQYGFYDRLTESFPSQIVVDSTEVCNLACRHCPHPDFKKSSHYGARYLDPELNAKMVEEVREFGQGKTQYIRYTSNGEPLVHKYAYDMVEDAVHRSGVYVTLTTNGTIMNEKRTQRLLEAGIHMIDISIDALLPETYAKVRVGGDLNITRENVLRLLHWVNNSNVTTKVVVSFVEQPDNKDEVEEFSKYWKDQGVDFVVIRRLHSASGAVPTIANYMRNENEQVVRKPCIYPWERIVLNARGYLSFCPADWTHESTIVDYKTTTINEVWGSDFYLRLRNSHVTNDFSKHKFCGQCPDWRETRWPGEGRSYADMISDFLTEET